jgi:hypothetical protein
LAKTVLAAAFERVKVKAGVDVGLATDTVNRGVRLPEETLLTVPLPGGAEYPPAWFRKRDELPALLSVTPFMLIPASAVVVLLAAMDVDPSVIGNPLPPLPPDTCGFSSLQFPSRS